MRDVTRKTFRGDLYVSLGAVNFKKGNMEKAWMNMEKALKAGVDAEKRTMIGSAYIQQGDAARGVRILEGVISDPKAGSRKEVAIVTCSMGYWRLGQHDKAISSLEELRATGYRNDNLSVNLETYLMEMGRLEKMGQLIAENRAEGVETNGLLDNRGWFCILTGDWDSARAVFDELINDRNAKFPEAYLHGAQVSIHDGNIQQAVDRLSWGTSKKFTLTCMTTWDYFNRLLMGLQNPQTRDAFAKAMDENYVDVSCSRPFPGLETAREFDGNDSGVIVPNSKPTYMQQMSSASHTSADADDINTDVDDDDREPNTDLDDDDVAIAAMYGQLLADDGDDDSPDTSVSDDEDDREPNTDLGDED